MKNADIASLLALAALWGGSYLFMRLGAGEFGAFSLAGLRATGAALCLLPLLVGGRGLALLRQHWRGIALVGICNSALPFVLFSFAALSLNAGLSAVLTAATPLWTALLAWLWLGDRPGSSRALGLAIGFAGVLWLVTAQAHFRPVAGTAASGWAVLACLGATLLYAFSANYSRQRLASLPPLVVAAGSQLASALCLALPTAYYWPSTPPSSQAWWALAALSLACTALAYVLFFRLIARVGAPRTMSVTYLIPAFGVLWGLLFLDESPSQTMLLACAVILLGTALGNGLIRRRPTVGLGVRNNA